MRDAARCPGCDLKDGDHTVWCPIAHPRESSAAYGRPALRVGDRVVLVGKDLPYKGEEGTITNSPGRVFNGWAVQIDDGPLVGVDRRYLRKVAS